VVTSTVGPTALKRGVCNARLTAQPTAKQLPCEPAPNSSQSHLHGSSQALQPKQLAEQQQQQMRRSGCRCHHMTNDSASIFLNHTGSQQSNTPSKPSTAPAWQSAGPPATSAVPGSSRRCITSYPNHSHTHHSPTTNTHSTQTPHLHGSQQDPQPRQLRQVSLPAASRPCPGHRGRPARHPALTWPGRDACRCQGTCQDSSQQQFMSSKCLTAVRIERLWCK
jgi:hypothetical protein